MYNYMYIHVQLYVQLYVNISIHKLSFALGYLISPQLILAILVDLTPVVLISQSTQVPAVCRCDLK